MAICLWKCNKISIVGVPETPIILWAPKTSEKLWKNSGFLALSYKTLNLPLNTKRLLNIFIFSSQKTWFYNSFNTHLLPLFWGILQPCIVFWINNMVFGFSVWEDFCEGSPSILFLFEPIYLFHSITRLSYCKSSIYNQILLVFDALILLTMRWFSILL